MLYPLSYRGGAGIVNPLTHLTRGGRYIDHSTTTDEVATPIALLLSEKIVVPLSIGVSAKVGILPRLVHDTDVHLPFMAIDHIEGFSLRLDPLDCGLAGQLPVPVDVADVRDVLMLALTIRQQ